MTERHKHLSTRSPANPTPSNRSRFATVAAGLIFAIVACDAPGQSIPPDTLERVKQATVMVTTSYSKNTEGDTLLGSGSGFFVNSTGLCISNDHVTDPGHGKSAFEKFRIWRQYNRLTHRVIVNSGTSDDKTYKADVLYSNDQADMAVMQVYDEDGEFLETPDYLTFLPTDELALKTKLWNLGFPGGDLQKKSRGSNPKVTIQSGSVTDIPRSPSGRVKGIRTSVRADGGNSGGPVVDREGRLVGIATLAGAGDTASSNFTVLIPADLTRQMIRIAFAEQKIPGGVDLYSFLDLLIDRDRIYRVPTLERMTQRSCVVKESETVLCGTPSNKMLSFPTPLGIIEVPASLMAYILTRDEFGMVLLDGGDRFRILREEATLEFTPAGGKRMEMQMDDVKSVSFALPSQKPRIPDGDVFVIGGDDFNLSIKNARGNVRFRTDDGDDFQIAITDIAKVETTEDDEIRLHDVYGSKILGSFEPHQLEGVLAWSDTPIKFSLEEVARAVMKTVNYAKLQEHHEPDLADSLSMNDARLLKVARHLDGGEIASAKDALGALLDPLTFRSFSKQKQVEVRRLEGEIALRSGHYQSAGAIFKRLKKATVEDVSWHARSRLAMIEWFENSELGGEVDLGDHEVFQRASDLLAGEHLGRAKLALEELEAVAGRTSGEPPKRTVYSKLVRKAAGIEESLLIANRLLGGTTEELVVRLWRNLADLHVGEAERLRREREDVAREFQRDANVPEFKRRDRARKLERFDSDVERAMENFDKMRQKLRNAGFIIDDSNIDIADAG